MLAFFFISLQNFNQFCHDLQDLFSRSCFVVSLTMHHCSLWYITESGYRETLLLCNHLSISGCLLLLQPDGQSASHSIVHARLPYQDHHLKHHTHWSASSLWKLWCSSGKHQKPSRKQGFHVCATFIYITYQHITVLLFTEDQQGNCSEHLLDGPSQSVWLTVC